MHTLANKIIEKGFTNRIFRASQLKRLVSGSPQSGYDLVNRAIKAKELVRFQRGLHMFAERFCDYVSLAQAFAPGSYI